MSKTRKYMYGSLLICGSSVLLLEGAWFASGAVAPADAIGQDAELPGPAPSEESDPVVMASLAAAPFPMPAGEAFEIDLVHSLRDMFSTTETIRHALWGGEGLAADGRDGERPSAAATARAFHQAHQLNGVMIGQALAVAVVNGKWLRVGDEIDGCTLTRVTGTTACFTCGEETVTLSVIPEFSESDSTR